LRLSSLPFDAGFGVRCQWIFPFSVQFSTLCARI
jgi:hypothetical protein